VGPGHCGGRGKTPPEGANIVRREKATQCFFKGASERKVNRSRAKRFIQWTPAGLARQGESSGFDQSLMEFEFMIALGEIRRGSRRKKCSAGLNRRQDHARSDYQLDLQRSLRPRGLKAQSNRASIPEKPRRPTSEGYSKYFESFAHYYLKAGN